MNPVGNILVFTQWSFKDALVQTYTLPYVDIIRKILPAEIKIFLVTAEQPQVALSKNGIIEVNREWEKKNMQLIAQSYQRFGLKKMIGSGGDLIKLIALIKKNNIQTIHAFCTPAGSIAYILSKFTGAALIIDSYEPHAEAMVENGTWKKGSNAFKILFSLEKKQTKKAAALIGTTAGMKKYAKEKYGVDVKNFFVKPACVDLAKFSPTGKDATLLKEFHLENKIVCVYAGKLGGIYLKREIFDFVRYCYDHWHDNFRFLMLTNASLAEVQEEMKRAGLPAESVISRFVYHQEIPKYLSLGDFAINPVKPVPTKRYCTSIKDGEYWAKGLPVVISPDISNDSEIICNERIGAVIDFTDKQQYSIAIKKIEQLLMSKNELVNKIRGIAERYRTYGIAEDIYRVIYGH